MAILGDAPIVDALATIESGASHAAAVGSHLAQIGMNFFVAPASESSPWVPAYLAAVLIFMGALIKLVSTLARGPRPRSPRRRITHLSKREARRLERGLKSTDNTGASDQ